MANPVEPKPGKGDEPSAKLTHSEDGVDLTLIRWMLSLTPVERLQVLQRNVQSILRLRGEVTACRICDDRVEFKVLSDHSPSKV